MNAFSSTGLALLLFLCLTSCDKQKSSSPETHEAWVSADALFRDVENFRGADSAYSADLGAGRVLWQFGDTFVGDVPNSRAGSVLVRNSMALQTGYNPETASLTFFHSTLEGQPTAMVAGPEPNWYWPGPLVMVGERLLLTYFEVTRVDDGLGFNVVGSAAFLVDNPAASPADWQMEALALPTLAEGVRFGTGALLLEGNYLYAYSVVEPGSHDVHLMRWEASSVEAGDLLSPEYYSIRSGWQSNVALSDVIVQDVQTEFTVHRDTISNQLILISVDGFGATNIVKRTASNPEGPWSDPVLVSRPEESERDLLVYSAKAHPHLTGGDMVVTYSSNSLDFPTLLEDMSIYFPRFQRLKQ